MGPGPARGRIARGRIAGALLSAALAGAGCGMLGPPGEDFRSVPAQARETSVDPGEAARMINAFRLGRGRAPLAVDPVLSRVAADKARTLARLDRMEHDRAGLVRRLEAAGFVPAAAAENLGAGYPTLELAVAGWRNSRGHRRNLLNPGVTRMGIGLALADGGRYRSYWVLIMARPAAGAPGGV